MGDENWRAASTFETWNPEEGDILIGRVIRETESEMDWGMAHSVTIEDEATGNEVEVRLNRTALKRQWENLAPETGARVKIEYHGMPEGKSYFVYKVFIDDDAPAWDGPKEDYDTDPLVD